MSTPLLERPGTANPVPKRRMAWAAAAAAVAIAVATTAIVLNGDDEPAVVAGPPMELTANSPDIMASCMQLLPEELAKAPVAFEGTVTSVDGDKATLTVDHWFKGGDQAEVVITAPPGLEALIAGFDLAPGQQYLVSAYEGTINYCGYSGLATPELRSVFDAAFPA